MRIFKQHIRISTVQICWEEEEGLMCLTFAVILHLWYLDMPNLQAKSFWHKRSGRPLWCDGRSGPGCPRPSCSPGWACSLSAESKKRLSVEKTAMARQQLWLSWVCFFFSLTLFFFAWALEKKKQKCWSEQVSRVSWRQTFAAKTPKRSHSNSQNGKI